MMPSRLPFNSPEMENPISNRRGVLTRSAAKALRQNNQTMSAALKDINQQPFHKTNSKTNKSSPDSLTPPRRKVLFTEDTKGGGDKENMASSSSTRRTRAGTPFRSNLKKDLNSNISKETETTSSMYYAIPSITTTDDVSSSKVTEDIAESDSDSSSGWSVWVLHTLVLFVAAAWLVNEHYSQQMDDISVSEATPIPSLEM